jgi:hypothetical protein
MNEFDFLIIAAPEFKEDVANLLATFKMNIKNYITEATSHFCIFDYPEINQYEKILYLDIQTILKEDITPIFHLEISDLLYGSETPGVLLFKKTETIMSLFSRIRENKYETTIYDNQLLDPYVNHERSSIFNFSSQTGKFEDTYSSMTRFLTKILYTEKNSTPIKEIVGKTYSWGDDKDAFVHFGNNILETKWGPGIYRILDNHTVHVTWSNCHHVMKLNDDYTEYATVCTHPYDFMFYYGKIKNIFYTVRDRIDGFGSQYHAILSGIAYSDYKKYKYLYSPFLIMEHGVDVNKLNSFIGIHNDSINKPEDGDVIISEPYSNEVHWSYKPSIYYTPDVLKKIREFYYIKEKPTTDMIDIAIHIRRGDVNKNDHPNRFTDNYLYIEIIKKLKIKYPGYKIHIFSQGVHGDFQDLGLDICFQLNTDIMETFHSLVRSKVLIMSKSSLSYSAALLNENTVYYMDFHHCPLDNWINVNDLLKMLT